MPHADKPLNIDTLRKQARKHIEEGAVTAGYTADRPEVLHMLNESLATELVCVLRYRRHHFMARGIHSQAVAGEFLAHANEELNHADQIASRIIQLGGEPDFSPTTLVTRSHAEYVEGTSLVDMISENLIAERIAIDSYRHFITYLSDQDPTTRRLLESILAIEEEHADDLADLLQHLPPPLATGQRADHQHAPRPPAPTKKHHKEKS
ncbi:ferritin-like domain-containing protein [Rhodoferax sp.]|uniref:ferritin-like domain-containing protein n=1 Tax=Rhodoferax sp. TaxID=50421 RepID=UPI00284E566A|nr:ferritin-like domain-containing protein [Rhodoferax sp.]MDR3368749.1 ferritin-like domain-containing protein [Rhodoferax sp.]